MRYQYKATIFMKGQLSFPFMIDGNQLDSLLKAFGSKNPFRPKLFTLGTADGIAIHFPLREILSVESVVVGHWDDDGDLILNRQPEPPKE